MVLHIIVPFKFKCSFKHAQKDYPSPSNDLFQVLDLTVHPYPRWTRWTARSTSWGSSTWSRRGSSTTHIFLSGSSIYDMSVEEVTLYFLGGVPIQYFGLDPIDSRSSLNLFRDTYTIFDPRPEKSSSSKFKTYRVKKLHLWQ